MNVKRFIVYLIFQCFIVIKWDYNMFIDSEDIQSHVYKRIESFPI